MQNPYLTDNPQIITETAGMRKARTEKIVLDRYDSYLRMEKGCFLVKHKNGESEKYPLFEDKIREVVLKTGNTVSVGSLASLGFWEIVLAGKMWRLCNGSN